jgi:hypothetical protein
MNTINPVATSAALSSGLRDIAAVSQSQATALEAFMNQPTAFETLAAGGDTRVAQAAIPGSPDNAFVNTERGFLGSPFFRDFGKAAHLVDDRNGHRAYANVNVSREGGGDILRVSGFSEAIKHVQNGQVPSQILVREYIVVRGTDNSQTVYQNNYGINGSVSGSDTGPSGQIGGTYGNSTSDTFTPVRNGDIRAINVRNQTSVSNDFSSAIQLPANALSFEYKLDVTFVYADGNRVSRSVAAQTDL